MPIPSEADREKLAEVALALLHLTATQDGAVVRAWKGLDWELMDVLHEKGWIGNPQNKNKSVVLTETGSKLSGQFFDKHFVR